MYLEIIPNTKTIKAYVNKGFTSSAAKAAKIITFFIFKSV